LINKDATIAGATGTRYANSGRIFMTTITVAINKRIRKKIFTLKYETGELAAKEVAYITIAVKTGYSTLLSSLANGHSFVLNPRASNSAGKSL
jgi:hypothetical protein